MHACRAHEVCRELLVLTYLHKLPRGLNNIRNHQNGHHKRPGRILLKKLPTTTGAKQVQAEPESGCSFYRHR